MRLLLFVLLIAVPVAAQDDLKREIAAIAAMRNDLQRLAAFDAFAAKLGLAPGSQATTSVAGKWSVSREVSPVDDSVTVTAHLQADSPAPSRRGRDGPAMILRYKEGKVDAYVVFDTFLGSESTTATVRFGKDPAVEQRWWISTDHKAAFVMGDALEFMRKLEQSDTFLIRVTPYSESPVTVSFSTAGVSKVVEAIGGMQLPNLEMLRARIRTVRDAVQVTHDIAERLSIENQAAQRNRAGMIWFCFYPPHRASENGIERFFRSWGGEALYNSHEDDSETGKWLTSIGQPCLVEAEVPIGSLSPFGRVEEIVARNYLVRRGLKTREECDLEVPAEKPIEASSIIGIHRFPSEQFLRLTECEKWIRPLI